jgi:hypothetical protein
MRRYFSNGGSSFLEKATKLTPGGAIANVVKKVIKSKEDKDSRNTNPKTPKMDSDKKEDNTFSKEKINKFFEDKKNNKVTKTAKNLSELKSGKIKTLPISSEQQNNKGKTKLQSAFNKG